MLFQQIYPFIVVFLLNAVCIGSEYSILVSSQHFPECKSLHWRHHATNSAVVIKGIEIDVFQWKADDRNAKPVLPPGLDVVLTFRCKEQLNCKQDVHHPPLRY